MIITRFPTLPDTTLAAVNTLGQWLALNDFAGKPHPVQADCIILAGNAVIPTIDAACQLAARAKAPLLVSGGVGHSTPFLYAAIARHPRYNVIRTTGRSEAAIIGDIARQFWRIPPERILLEDKSTNCGENARLSCELLRRQLPQASRVVVVQDPTMQRRTMATFARVSEAHPGNVRFLSWPGVTPLLRNGQRGLSFTPREEGLWATDRYLSLILGEIPRLRDDEQGYGPRGRNFIAHVEFPASIDAAWRTLQNDDTLNAALRDRALR